MTRHHKLKPHEITVEREEPRSTLLGVLGPTNTGKTHYAIERMLSHPTGMIGLPLRLLAREVYDRLVARRPADSVALVTGEEKIVPPGATHWVATVEAMPLDRKTDFLAVDEIQLAADPERGRVFTSRLLAARGRKETLLLGSETMRPILKRLFPEIGFQSMERFSALAYAGSKKVTRNPRRTAIVGFSADTVYSVAELIRRQRGGAAVVLGALSPRTRNAQAELYQSGEVDYLVATDAIGMGLNMDIDHVAFAAARKFDGRAFRDLRPDELAQIAGRAGRHIRDGTFGETADCATLDDAVIEAIENHAFEPVEALQWRSDELDLTSIANLKRSLDTPSARPELRRARPDEDEEALMRLSVMEAIADRVHGVAATTLLWEVCQTPDFRKTAIDQHVGLLANIFEQIVDGGRIADDWFAAKVAPLERTDGDIDTISMRISHVRTWTYLSNRSGWVENAAYWQGRTRAIEDSLSDALHEKLTQRFVDRRTSVLLKKLRDEAPVLAGVTDDGDVIVEGQFVGRLLGFEFAVDPRATGADAKRIRGAAERALAPVLAARAASLATAEARDLQLKDDGVVWWRSSPVAELKKGPATLRPEIVVRSLDAISPHMRGQIVDRLTEFVAAKIEVLLTDLIAMKRAVDATGDDALTAKARGVAYRLVENFGAMSRTQFGEELKQLSQEERARLRKLGVRFGEYTLHVPSLLKPAAARMMTLLWALWSDRDPASLALPKPGLVSIAAAGDLPHAYYYALGYRPSGDRAVRIDMLERLAQQIRSARTSDAAREGFEATSQMMSLVGCSGEDFEGILRSLGYRKHTIKRAPRAAQPEAAPTNEPPPAGDAPTLEPQADAEPVDEAPVDPAPLLDVPEEAAAPVIAEPPPVEPAAAAPAETGAEIEVAVWRLAPRRPPQPRQQECRDNRQGKNASGNAGARHDGQNKPDRGPREARGNGKKPPRKGGGDAAPRRFTSEPRRGREPDPNSPFAVLASLKATMTGRDGKPE